MDQKFAVDLPALIANLSEHLYSEKQVAVRELIQNARDSLLQRRSLPGRVDEAPAITVSVSPSRHQLVISDNGVGMTAEQAQRHLAVIASSGTRLLRADLAEEADTLAKQLSGQFGLGFLSALIIADRIELRSRSRVVPSAPAILWTCARGNSNYCLDECAWNGQGTEVTLTLSKPFRDLTLPTRLVEVVKKYCDLVEFPICLPGHSRPINRMQAPWHAGAASEVELVDFLRETGRIETDEEPAFVSLLPMTDHLGGILFLPARPGEDGKIDLYVRRLYVGRTADCVPEDLDFLHGVLECPNLPLTLSRESVVKGGELDRLRERIKVELLRHLAEARRQRPNTYRRVLAGYSRSLKIAALKDEDVMAELGAGLPVKLITGKHTSVGEVAELNGDKITFIDDPAQQAYGSLYAARGISVVDCSDRLDHMFVHKFGQMKDAKVVRADISLDQVVEPTVNGEWRVVEELLAQCDDEIDVTAVELDSDLPALFLKDQGDEIRDMIANAKKMRTGDNPMNMLMEMFGEVMSGRLRGRRTMYLNVRHALSRALLEAVHRQVDAAVVLAAARILLASARAYSATLDAAERKNAFAVEADALTELLRHATASSS